VQPVDQRRVAEGGMHRRRIDHAHPVPVSCRCGA